MKTLYLENKKEIMSEEESSMKLSYYLVEISSEEVADSKVYGIKIEKEFSNEVESETVERISYSKEMVKGLIKKLWEYEVTPVGMIYAIDDWISQMDMAV